MLAQMYLTFIEVAKNKSFAKAAHNLFISRVSVMKQMNNLEASLQLRLFVRSNRGIELTKAGQQLYQQVIAIKHQADVAIEKVKMAATYHEKVRINLGVSMMRPATPLMKILRETQILEKFELNIRSFDDQAVNLNTPSVGIGRKIDCIVGPCDARQWEKNYNIYILGSERFKVAVPFGNELSNKSLLEPIDLEGQTLIMPPRDAIVANEIYNFLTADCKI